MGNLYRCDVGRFNDRTFIYIAAFGLFTDVSYQTSQDMKNALGHVAYLLEGAKKLFDIKSFHLKVKANGMILEKDFVYGMVTNSRSIGGFKNLARQVDMNDGLFEVTLIEMPKDPSELSQILGAIMLEEDNTELVHTFKTSALKIETRGDCPWTLDGEYGGNPLVVEIENRHKALNLCLTSTKPAAWQEAQSSQSQAL